MLTTSPSRLVVKSRECGKTAYRYPSSMTDHFCTPKKFFDWTSRSTASLSRRVGMLAGMCISRQALKTEFQRPWTMTTAVKRRRLPI